MGFLRRRFSHPWYARDWTFPFLATLPVSDLINLRGVRHAASRGGEILARLLMFLFMFFLFCFHWAFLLYGRVCLGLELSNDYNDFNDFTT
jgi:hypothetical protein